MDFRPEGVKKVHRGTPEWSLVQGLGYIHPPHLCEVMYCAFPTPVPLLLVDALSLNPSQQQNLR